jgi:hypothetical protein
VQTKQPSGLISAHSILAHSRISKIVNFLGCLAFGPTTYRQILLVQEDQQDSILELVLLQHAHQLIAGLVETSPVIAVYYEDDTLCVLEVVAPQRSDLVLSTNVPNGEGNVLVFDGLDVKACRNRALVYLDRNGSSLKGDRR